MLLNMCLSHFRYVAAERYSEALDILQSGACTQLKHEQVKASCIFSAYVITGLNVILAFVAQCILILKF